MNKPYDEETVAAWRDGNPPEELTFIVTNKNGIWFDPYYEQRCEAAQLHIAAAEKVGIYIGDKQDGRGPRVLAFIKPPVLVPKQE